MSQQSLSRTRNSSVCFQSLHSNCIVSFSDSQHPIVILIDKHQCQKLLKDLALLKGTRLKKKLRQEYFKCRDTYSGRADTEVYLFNTKTNSKCINKHTLPAYYGSNHKLCITQFFIQFVFLMILHLNGLLSEE